jgi:hypothetical protein
MMNRDAGAEKIAMPMIAKAIILTATSAQMLNARSAIRKVSVPQINAGLGQLQLGKTAHVLTVRVDEISMNGVRHVKGFVSTALAQMDTHSALGVSRHIRTSPHQHRICSVRKPVHLAFQRTRMIRASASRLMRTVQ